MIEILLNKLFVHLPVGCNDSRPPSNPLKLQLKGLGEINKNLKKNCRPHSKKLDSTNQLLFCLEVT